MAIVKEMLMKAFTERMEAAKKASVHTIKIMGSVEVQRTKAKPKDSFAEDYKLELKAVIVIMVYTEADQTFKVFENSCLLNSCSS
jgi:hypothetical protein